MINFLNLEYFLVAAEELNFTKAAKRLYISQQSLSNHISNLEKEFDIALFHRTTPLTLTYAGQVLEKRAREILELREETYHEIADIKDFSKGMKVKLAFAVALSHNAELLILDEATSGLDPIIRDDVLDMLIDFVQDESHSVLVSSHITSDLEKVADYITFIHKGNLIFTHEKDNLIDNYGILNCGAAVFDTLDKTEVVAYRKEDYQFKVLVKDRNKAAKQYANAIVGPATIEEIMLFYVKGEMQ